MNLVRFASALLAVTLVMGCAGPRSSRGASDGPAETAGIAASTDSGTDIIDFRAGTESDARTGHRDRPVSEAGDEKKIDLEQRYVALRMVAKSLRSLASDAERGRHMAEAFDRLFPEPAESTVAMGDPRGVRAHLNALSELGFYQHGRAEAGQALMLLHALEQAGAVLPGDAEHAQAVLIIARRFEDAAELAGRYSHLEKVPAFRRLDAPAARSIWAVEEGPTLTQLAAPLPPGLQLVVTSHPHCGFSAQLLADAEDDEELRGLLSGALWLTPVGDHLSTKSIAEWNERAPWASLHLVNAHAEWPEISDWTTPVFHFVKDGQVLEKVVGWPRDGRREELMTAARRSGLLEEASE